MRLVVLMIAVLLIAGCTTPSMNANVTAFHTPELQTARGKTIIIRPDTPAKETSLEFLNYRPKVAAKLQHVGFTVVEDPAAADYIARISYGVDGTETYSATTASPVFGLGYYGGPFYYGGSFSRRYDTRTWVEYNRFIALEIIDGKYADTDAPPRIYEGRAQSTGSCPTIAGVFDEVLEALFRDFPGANGRTTFVTIPWDGSCE